MSIMNTIVSAGAVTLAMALSACVVNVGNRSYPDGPDIERWYVNEAEMSSLVNSNKQLTLGMAKDEALAIYGSNFTTLMSSAKVGDKVVEEWRVQAYEGTRTNVKTSFRRWLYFTDGKLARFGEDRVDYVNQPNIVDAWN